MKNNGALVNFCVCLQIIIKQKPLIAVEGSFFCVAGSFKVFVKIKNKMKG